MSQDGAIENPPQEEVPQVPQALVREAGHELTTKLYDYAEICWELQDLEARLVAARKKRVEMLRVNPWLGNVQGIINKEAFKMAKTAQVPPEEEALASDHMEEVIEAHEQKDVVALIPKKKKPGPRPIRNDTTPEAVRARILKKSNKIAELAQTAKSQFGPEHPSHPE